MPFEIDFLPVGDGERSGDAIALRFGDLTDPNGQKTVAVIDGGTKDSGEALVKLIREHYHTGYVNYVISTHPDMDHASGLSIVMEELDFGQLIMHRPWEHSEDICHLFDSPNITPSKLENKMEKNLQAARELERIALRKKKEIVEPFQGVGNQSKSIMVLGPSEEYYCSLLPHFRDMPTPKIPEATTLSKRLMTAAADVVEWVMETADIETLKNPEVEDTSAENRSSTIILLTIDGQNLLFTGDAGTESLTLAVDYAGTIGINLSQLQMLHVPHHGSRRNLGPEILNRLRSTDAIISASPAGAPKHPSKKVVNALKRRGSFVCATQGAPICYRSGMPLREGYRSATPLPFYNMVEAE